MRCFFLSSSQQNKKKRIFSNGIPNHFWRQIIPKMPLRALTISLRSCKKFLYFSKCINPCFNRVPNAASLFESQYKRDSLSIGILSNKKYGKKLSNLADFFHICSIVKFRKILVFLHAKGFTNWPEKTKIYCEKLDISRALDYHSMLRFFDFQKIDYVLYKEQTLAEFVNHPQIKICSEISVEEVTIEPNSLYDQIKHLKSIRIRSPLQQNFPSDRFLCPLINSFQSAKNPTLKHVKIESCRTVVPDYRNFFANVYLLYKSAILRSEVHTFYLILAKSGLMTIRTDGSFGFAKQELQLHESIESVFVDLMEKIIFPMLRRNPIDFSIFFDEFANSESEKLCEVVERMSQRLAF